MGLDSSQASDVRNYSSKVLKIELSGPRRSHFAILDLPGIFSALVGGVSKRERDGVTMMVSSYMKKPENIIMSVEMIPSLTCLLTLLSDVLRMLQVISQTNRFYHWQAPLIVHV